jgi:hypothetical protein
MCGACGSAPDSHWSAPFLATLPARSSAAGAATAIATRAGSQVRVTAVAGGYAVATPTGRCLLAANLREVWQRLRQLGSLDGAVPPVPPRGMASAGPATLPPMEEPVLNDASTRLDADSRLHRIASTSWPHRLPMILAWLAAVDERGPRRLAIRLGLTSNADFVVDVADGTVVRCTAISGIGGADGSVELDDPSGSFSEPLAALLEPMTVRPWTSTCAVAGG